jgi:hypothetical protein
MASNRLDQLPPELLSKIADALAPADLSSFSRVCSHFRAIAAPLIFHTILIGRETPKEVDSLRGVADKHGHHVRRLHFTGKLHEGDYALDKEPAASSAASSLFPTPIVEAINGQLFPSASTVLVDFGFDFNNDDPPGGGNWEHEGEYGEPCDFSSIYAFEAPEEPGSNKVVEKEDRYLWRRLMAEFWRHLCQNRNITALHVPALLPKAASPWFTPQWTEFLCHLQKLDLRMWCEDNRAGWEANTVDGYTHFVEHLGRYFFDDARHLDTLMLSAHPRTPFGDASMSCWPCRLPLPAVGHEGLRNLSRLELSNIFVTSELASYILEPGRSSLRSLTLQNGHISSWTRAGESFYRWADFFGALDTDALPLTHFSMTYSSRPAIHDPYDQEDLEADDPEKFAHVQRVNEASDDDGPLAFSYGNLDDKYGFFHQYAERNFEEYLAGKDAAAYNKLRARTALALTG